MTHIDRRAMTNGKRARVQAQEKPATVTLQQWMAPEHNHRPVTRGELKAYGDELGAAIEWRRYHNAWHRRVGRWARSWWAFLVTPRAKAPAQQADA